jgi:hypothetical protein
VILFGGVDARKSMDIDDENERPTLPSPLTSLRAFDTAAEAFFAVPLGGGEADVEDEVADEALALWWVEQRRRGLQRVVTALMVLCAAVLATALR